MVEAAIALCVVSLIVWLGTQYEEYRKDKERRSCVASIVSAPVHDLHRDLEACTVSVNIREEHRLTKDEMDAEFEILESFRQWLMRCYSDGTLVFPKEDKKKRKKLKKESQTYLSNREEQLRMCLLSFYLSDRAGCYRFSGHDMAAEIIFPKGYEGSGSDTVYSISDFAVVFYKILNISFQYCKTKTAYLGFPGRRDWVEEILDKKEIEVLRYIH